MFRDEELPPEEVNEVLGRIAVKVVDHELELFARFLLGMSWPLAFIGGQMGRVFLSPYLFVFGDKEDNMSKKIFIFEKRENIFKLIDKIDALSEERYEEKKRKKKADRKNGIKDSGMMSKIWKKLRGASS
jgi:hypothetical protein